MKTFLHHLHLVVIILLGINHLQAQTNLLDIDFTSLSGNVPTNPVSYPYNIDNNTNCTANDNWRYSTTAGSTSTTCNACADERAIIDYGASTCDQDATLVLGAFTGNSSIDISFDYAFRSDGAPDALIISLYNKTTASVATTLVNLISNLNNGNYSGNHSLSSDEYEVRVQYIGDYGWGAQFDNLLVVSNCTAPSISSSIVNDCGNGQFSVEVTVNSLGDASAVDINSTPASNDNDVETNVGIGTYTFGPYNAGTSVSFSIVGSAYGGCDLNLGTVSEDCACINTPTATVDDNNLNCTSSIFDIEVTLTDFGDGSSADIYIDGSLEHSNASLGQLYIFSGYATGTHMITIKATGGAFVSCNTDYLLTSVCNGSDAWSTAAPNILGTCSAGDLSLATIDGPTDFGPNCHHGNVSGFGNNFLRPCEAGFDNTTDFTDVWYQVDLPDGTDEMTLTVTGLAAGEYLAYVLHTGDPGSSSDNNVATATIPALTGSTDACTFFSQTETTRTIASLSDESTAPIYIRILAADPDQNLACGSFNHPSFTICASAPQANDICNDGLTINSFDDDVLTDDSYAPVNQSGDISQASTDTDTHDDVDGETCNGINFSTGEQDLWYKLHTPNSGNFYVNIDIDFTGVADEIYVLLHNYCAAGDTDPIGCASISADGTVSFDESNITNFENALTADTDYNIRIVLPTGSNATTFDISAQLIAENNSCEVMQTPFPGFDIVSNKEMNFNFASDSGSDPVITGRDLWYQFDPISSTDANGFTLGSTTAEIIIGGLESDQEVTLVLYKGNTVSGNNCVGLNSDYLETLTNTGGGTAILSCLDELHTSVDGGYILRVIQTAGANIIDDGLIRAEPNPAGPYNNDCENIWNGSGPTNLGVGDASTYFNPYYIPAGFANYVTADFENATDCNPSITSAICNGVNYAAISESDDNDLWFVFEVPDNECSSLGLTQSTVVTSMDITYNAGSQFRDGVMFVYDGCGDGNLIDCSGSLDGAAPGTTWTVNGLTQGEFYLLRVKPDLTNTDFEYSIDVTVEEGVAMPCNDDAANAESLSVLTCNDYGAIEEWSAKGASKSSPVTGAGENDVWFSFTAPDPANGGDYTTAASWVTVFFEAVSGEGLWLDLYNTKTTKAGGDEYSVSGANGKAWAQFGNLTPGQTYWLRLYHKELADVNVKYKIAVTTGTAVEPGWACGVNQYDPVSACSDGCGDLREQWFKIDLPDNTPGNHYWMIEVVGYDEHLDFELRSKWDNSGTPYIACDGTAESAAEGTCADYDHPCSSIQLESPVSISSTTTLMPGGVGLTTGENCDDATTTGTDEEGRGIRRVYFNMNGAVSGQKDYYYLRVFMSPSDPNYATKTDIFICQLNFMGPYTTAALADAGGAPDGGNCDALLPVDFISFDTRLTENAQTKLEWTTATEINNDYFEIQHSLDGQYFETLNKLSGKNIVNQVQHYKYIHERPSTGINYYRIKQVDFDGKYTFTEIKAVNLKESQAYLIYPTQANDVVFFKTQQPIEADMEVVIYNAMGLQMDKEILRRNKSVLSFDVSTFNPGVYFIRYLNQDRTFEAKQFIVLE